MPATLTMAEAEVEAAARAARHVAVLAPLWKAARRWTAAVVLAAFPFLFLVDKWVHWPVSPVLPGLVLLALLIVLLPFGLVELSARRYRRRDLEWQARRAARSIQVARAAVAIAAIWLVAWFAVAT
jgi:uncharacterized membrane protein